MDTPLQGRRRESPPAGELPPDLEHGDYWLELGEPWCTMAREREDNLTKTAWGYYLAGFGAAYLCYHTVREHEDGTISVLPNDGSSNSIKCTKGGDVEFFHGYIRRGVWVLG